jgi:nucleotide-binding universal stress UspA family protein
MNEVSPTKRVIVGYDGSPPADDALTWAIDSATRMQLPLHVVVAMPELPVGAVAALAKESDGLPGNGATLLAASGLSDVSVEEVHDRAGPSLRRAGGAGDLLVVGSLGHGRVAGALVGSVSRYLVRNAECPVVVVRPAAGSTAEIIVGVDGSEESILALGWAYERARTTGEDVVAVHGFRSGIAGGGLGAQVDDELTQHVVRAETRLRDWIDRAPVVNAPGVRAEAIPVSPGDLLVDLSKHASVVVVGARGPAAVPGLHLGSVADHVVARARCPVVVVR